MARKSRATPATIAQLLKLDASKNAKQKAYYSATDKYNQYKERVEELGNGYTEVVDGVTYVIAFVPQRYVNGNEMTLVKCKK